MRPDMPRTRGFSLVELVIVIIVIGIMAAVLSPLMLSSLRAYDTTLGNVVVLDKLRYATERLAREIREVNYNSNTGFAFTSMGANTTTFTRTFYNSSGTATVATVTVGNTGSAVTLAYSTPAVAAQILTDELGNSSNLVFSYLDQNGTVLGSPTPTTVYAVRIALTLIHNGQPYTQRTQVELKNRS